MITYKFKFNSDKEFYDILKEGNKIFRIAFNLFNKGYDSTNVENIIKKQYNYNSNLIDASMLKSFCRDADTLIKSYKTREQKTLIFGGRKNYKDYLKGLISKEDWFKIRNTRALSFCGDKNSKFGNRKFDLNIENSKVIFKPNRNRHIKLNLIGFKKRYNDLLKIQMLSEQKLIPVSYRLDSEFVYISFDESFLKKEEHEFVKDRTVGLDLNPNYIGFVISDKEETIYKEVIDISELNKTHNKNKKDYEVIQIAKRLSKLCKHYKVEIVGYEDLNIKSKDYKKGRNLNRLINNSWNRQIFINNFKKRLNILGIKNQSIKSHYSSTIGCLNNPLETDCIAAAIEISRRVFVFKKKFIDRDKEFLDMDIIYPVLDYKLIKERWNSILSGYNPTRIGWKSIHEYLKKQKKLTLLRFLFKDYNFNSWSFLRNQSRKSLTCSYFSI